MSGAINQKSWKGRVREVLLKGMAQYGWPACTNQFRSAPFYIEKIINLFYKTSYFNEEVNCTEPPPLVSIPWSGISDFASYLNEEVNCTEPSPLVSIPWSGITDFAIYLNEEVNCT